MNEKAAQVLNVCGIRLTNTHGGIMWWQCNSEHGAGWTERIRQAWTLRECGIEMAKIEELCGTTGVEIVELVQGNPVNSNPPAPESKVDWEKPLQTETGESVSYLGSVPSITNRCRVIAVSDGTSGEYVGACNVFGADCKFIDDGPFGPHTKIINTLAPAVVEFAYECCIASHPKRDVAIAIRISGVIDVHILTATGARYEYTSEQAAIIHDWNLSPWQRQKVVG